MFVLHVTIIYVMDVLELTIFAHLVKLESISVEINVYCAIIDFIIV